MQICCWAGFTKHSYGTKELKRKLDEDYVNHNNHRKHAEGSNSGVFMPIRVLGRVRNDSNVRMDSQNENVH